MTTAQQRNARKLLRALKAMPDSRCDMGVFTKVGTRLNPVGHRGTHTCGTTACLAGWAALICAPSRDAKLPDAKLPDGYRYTDEERVLLPQSWVTRHNVPVTTWLPRRRIKGVQHVPVHIAAAGRALLGPGLGNVFYETDGPKSEGVTDREWMIRKLEAALARAKAKEA